MSGILQKLIEVSATVGNITDVHLYNNDFINIEGVTADGKKFSLSLHMREEEKDGN